MATEQTNRRKYIWHVIAVLWGALVFEVFFVLSVRYFHASWSEWLFFLVLIGGSVLNALLFSGELIAYFFQKEAVYKACIILYVLLSFLSIVFFILLKTGFLEIVRDSERLEDYLQRSGKWMVPLFILLQFLQVVVLPIPSTVTVAVGSALFGPFLGSVYSLIGIVIGSLTAFLVGRYAGYRVVVWIVGESTLKKWIDRLKGKDKLLLSFMFLLPVFPDDVLCFIAGLSTMSFPFFIAVIVISRVLAIFSTSYLFFLIPFTTWWGILIWLVLGAAVIALFVFLYKNYEKLESWLVKRFHLEPARRRGGRGDYTIEIIDPDGTTVTKKVEKKP